MRYTETTVIADTNLTSTCISWSANGIYDPRTPSLGGHAPLTYNLWASIYDTWIVAGSKMQVTFCPGGIDEGDSTMRAGVFVADQSYQGTGLDPLLPNTWIESGLGTWRAVQSSVNIKPAMCTAKFSAKKWFNLTSIRDNNPLYGSTFPGASNPTHQAYYNVWVGPMVSGGTTPVPLTLQVVIDYLVIVGEPKLFPGSSA
jgi:hypothetical protein